MARDEGAGSGTVLLAFILGAVSGAAVALLYAPQSGAETRELLGDKARVGRERAAAAAEKVREVLSQGRDTMSCNDVARADIGFQSDENALTVIWSDGEQHLEKAGKSAIARQLVALLAVQLKKKEEQ